MAAAATRGGDSARTTLSRRGPRSERLVAAQRAAAGQPPAPEQQQDAASTPMVAGAAAGAAVIPAVAAAGAAAAALAGLPGLPDGGSPAGAAARQAVMGAVDAAAVAILGAFDEAMQRRRDGMEARVLELFGDDLVGVPADVVRQLAREEVERERVFQAKARDRLRRDLPVALAVEDVERRRVAVRRILERERRFALLREEAVRARAGGRVEFARLRAILEPQGVQGMFWRLNPRLVHCAKCLALGGRVWPWRLLALYHPPMHLNCGCRLWPPTDAVRLGWVAADAAASVDETISMIHLLESARDPDRDPEGYWLPAAGVAA